MYAVIEIRNVAMLRTLRVGLRQCSLRATNESSSGEQRSRQITTFSNGQKATVTANDVPSEARVIIYGDELVSKSLASLFADSELQNDVLVVRGNGLRNGRTIQSFNPDLNSFYLNHLIVSNPRSSLLIRASTEMFNMNRTGAIYLAQTDERVKSFKRMISISKLFIPKELGEMRLLSPEEIRQMYPFIEIGRVKCGIYVPFDGVVHDRKQEEDKLESYARSKGVKFLEEFVVNRINISDSRVSHVELIHPLTHETAKIRCEYFVNSANNYLSRNIGKCSNVRVRIPTLACEHQILVTDPYTIQHDKPFPILTDFDNRFTLYQQKDNSFCITGYERQSHVVRKRKFFLIFSFPSFFFRILLLKFIFFCCCTL